MYPSTKGVINIVRRPDFQDQVPLALPYDQSLFFHTLFPIPELAHPVSFVLFTVTVRLTRH